MNESVLVAIESDRVFAENVVGDVMNESVLAVVVVLACVIAVVCVAVVCVARVRLKKKNCSDARHQTNEPVESSEEEVSALFNRDVKAVRKKAMSYALYQELLEHPLSVAKENKLYAKYGRYYVPPRLDRPDELDNPETKRKYLRFANAWLTARGEKDLYDYIEISEKIGEVLVKECRPEILGEIELIRQTNPNFGRA